MLSIYNPLITLILFLVISIALYFVFRPNRGLYHLLARTKTSTEKTALEDILKLIYHNQIANKSLNAIDLTKNLNYSNSLLIDSVNKMIASELIYMEGETIRLSKTGNEYALRIVRAHRLWEKFLSEKTGFDKEEWHERAEIKEHQLSVEETDQLASLLGNPIYDPHGDPIPSRTGKIVTTSGTALSKLEVGAVGRISHIEDEPDIIYRQILAESIHIGSQIRVVENNNIRVVFHSEGEKFILAPIVAGNITVSVLKKMEIHEEDTVRLSSLKEHEMARILGLSKECRGENRRRLLDLGFVKGSEVQIDLMNPLGDPKAFLIKGTTIALRKDQSSKILIKKISNG